MNIKYIDKKHLADEILRIVGESLDLEKYKVFFFGSRVSGKNDEHSDVDVGILGDEKISAKAMEEIREKIENLPTLYTIEMVDFFDVSEDFKKVAMENVEYINH